MAHDGQFLLIESVSRLISNASSDASNKHKSKLIGIDDILSVDAGGKVPVKNDAKAIISKTDSSLIMLPIDWCEPVNFPSLDFT